MHLLIEVLEVILDRRDQRLARATRLPLPEALADVLHHRRREAVGLLLDQLPPPCPATSPVVASITCVVGQRGRWR